MRRVPLHIRTAVGVLSLLTTIAACTTHPAYNFVDTSGPLYVEQLHYSPPAKLRDSSKIKVVSFNIQFARQIDKAVDQMQASSLSNADLVLLQEMDLRGVEQMARTLGYNYVYAPATVHSNHGRLFGNAILVRGQVVEGWKVLLPHMDHNRLHRIAVGATVQIGVTNIDVYSIHLGTRLSPGVRRDQMLAVSRFIAEKDGDGPIIIGGDMNTYTGLHTRPITEILGSQGFRHHTQDIVGGSIRHIPLVLDHIYSRGFEPVSGRRVKHRNPASDHWPVVTTLTLERRQ